MLSPRPSIAIAWRAGSTIPALSAPRTHFGTITRSVWSESWGAQPRNVTSMRRNLQRLYVDRMHADSNLVPVGSYHQTGRLWDY